jgi:hypothetical protein
VKTPPDGWSPEEREAISDLAAELDALQRKHPGDPPLALLRAARAGVLPEPLQTQVSERLHRSAWDRALVDGLAPDADSDGGLDAVTEARIWQRIRQDHLPQTRARAWSGRAWPSGLAAAAVLVLAVGGWTWLRNREPDPQPEAQSPRILTDRRLPSPTFALQLDAPTIKLSASALVFRGEVGTSGLLNDLKPALDAFRAGDYAAADREFGLLASRYGSSIDVAFYAGVTRLFLGDLSGADERFVQAELVGDEAFTQDIAWYRAIVDERAGRREQARARLTALCQQKGARATQACAGAAALSQ